MTIALHMRRKLNEFRMTNFLELASPLIALEQHDELDRLNQLEFA